MPAPVNVFISYSHKDSELKDQLLEHFAGLSNEGVIRVWHDRQIDAGDYWVSSIDNQLELSSIILLLVSPSFLASDYCYGVELERALEREAAGEARVIPIILRPADWKTSKVGALQALPTNGRAITTWSNLDEACLDVAAGLRSTIIKLQDTSQGSSVVQSPDITQATQGRPARYYLYVSDSKIDMLFPQVSQSLKEEVARDFGIPVSASFWNSSSAASEAERLYRLETVVRFIRQQRYIGSIDHPKEYIAGTDDLLWGNLHGSFLGRGRDKVNPLIFFSGWFEKTTLLMCGSSRHLIGSLKPRNSGFSSSSIPHVIESIMAEIEIADKPIPAVRASGLVASHEKAKIPNGGNELVLELVNEAGLHMSGASQKLEYLAKTLLQGPSPRWKGHCCVLASPIYVSLAF